MNLALYDDKVNLQDSAVTQKTHRSVKRRQTQLFSIALPSGANQKMPKGTSGDSRSQQQHALNDVIPRTDIGIFLRKLGKPVSDIQKILTEYPKYEDQFIEYHETKKREEDFAKDLEQRDQRIRELEAGVATFDSVHIKASETLKAEVKMLKERLVEADKRAAASKKEFAKDLEKLITQHNQTMEKTQRDHSAALIGQKTSLEKQHLEITEKQLSQLNIAYNELQKKRSEIDELDWKNNGLKKKLDQSNGMLNALQQELSNIPDDIFESKWRELAEVFHLFCKTRFTSPPQGLTIEETKSQQQDIKEKLRRSGFADKVPFPIPTGNIEASKLLRLAGVESLISQSLCENVFRPVVIPNCSYASGIFESISERLHRDSPWKEAVWRSLTINALIEDSSNIDQKAEDMAMDILKLTSPLIPYEDQESVRTELIELFKLSFDTWLPVQKNSTRIFATTDLADNSLMAWDSQQEQDDFGGVSEDDLKDIDPHSKVLCLFPRVYRERASTTGSDIGGDDGYVYYPGTALYADSGAYVAGQKEYQEYKRLMEELEKKAHVVSTDLAKINSRRSRRPSINKATQQLPPPPLSPTSLKVRTTPSQAVVEKKTGSSVVSSSSQRDVPKTPK